MIDLHKLIIEQVNIQHSEWEYIALGLLEENHIDFITAFTAVYELKTGMKDDLELSNVALGVE